VQIFSRREAVVNRGNTSMSGGAGSGASVLCIRVVIQCRDEASQLLSQFVM
jgi:hypothetical protein